MYQPIAVYIGLHYTYRRTLDGFSSFISWISTIGIMFGVTSLVTILSVMNGVENELKKNILDLIPQVLLTTSEGNIDPNHLPDKWMKYLQNFVQVLPLTFGEIILQSTQNLTIGMMLGVKPTDPEPLIPYLIDVNINQLVSERYQIILGEQLAKTLGVKRGDSLRLIIPNVSQFTPLGRIPIHRIFTVAGIYSTNSEVDCYQFLVNQEDASRLMLYPKGYVTGLRLWLKQPFNVDSISKINIPDGMLLKDWRERKGELFQAVRMEKNMITILLSLIITIAEFNIIASVILLSIEKQGEIAILQTQGMSRIKIMMIFMSNGLNAGICGSLLGSILGIILSSYINFIISVLTPFFNVSDLPIKIDYYQVIIISFFSIIIAIISTIYPSWRVAYIPPYKTLRYYE